MIELPPRESRSPHDFRCVKIIITSNDRTVKFRQSAGHVSSQSIGRTLKGKQACELSRAFDERDFHVITHLSDSLCEFRLKEWALQIAIVARNGFPLADKIRSQVFRGNDADIGHDC